MMVSVVWALILWTLVFLFIPYKRIRRLWKIIVISFIWLFFVDFIFVHFGYYRFQKSFIPVLEIPLFYMIGGSAGGVLLINWLPRRPIFKVLYIAMFNILFLVSEQAYIFVGEFQHLNWNTILGFTQNMAGLLILAEICTGVIGEEVIYKGQKSNF